MKKRIFLFSTLMISIFACKKDNPNPNVQEINGSFTVDDYFQSVNIVFPSTTTSLFFVSAYEAKINTGTYMCNIYFKEKPKSSAEFNINPRIEMASITIQRFDKEFNNSDTTYFGQANSKLEVKVDGNNLNFIYNSIVFSSKFNANGSIAADAVTFTSSGNFTLIPGKSDVLVK